MLDPLVTTAAIDDALLRYLESTFSPRSDDLRSDYEHALRHDACLSRGPFLQITAPFVPGVTLQSLIDEGVLSHGWKDMSGSIPLDRPLHRHQEVAIRKAVSHRRNLIVSTGTGSGKTESFLVPIVESLLRERQAGTLDRPGVRALLLYPMNALANDQVKRLRSLLADAPDITFGRYTGETPQTQVKAEEDYAQRHPNQRRLPNELISRAQMQAEPPRILLTNYAMLEYLLMRPADSTFFDGPPRFHP